MLWCEHNEQLHWHPFTFFIVYYVIMMGCFYHVDLHETSNYLGRDILFLCVENDEVFKISYTTLTRMSFSHLVEQQLTIQTTKCKKKSNSSSEAKLYFFSICNPFIMSCITIYYLC